MMWLVLLVAIGWRTLLCARTGVPSEDGVTYLWMAQRIAEGDWGSALNEVFPPLLPALTAPWIAMGATPFVAAQCTLAVTGALAVVPIARLCQRLLPGSLLTAAWLVALAGLPARFCGEVYTEPLFLLTSAMALHAASHGWAWRLGIWVGVSFWLRPEALLLLLVLWGMPRKAWAQAGLLALASVAALAALRGWCGHGYHPLPKLTFNMAKSAVAGTETPSLWQNLIELPTVWIEAFGPLGVLAGLAWFRRTLPLRRELVWILIAAAVVLVLFLPRKRFLVSWFAVLMPLALAGLWSLPGRLPALALTLVVGHGIVVGLDTTAPDRSAEVLVGRWLRTQLGPNEEILSDLPRINFGADIAPQPPRHLSAEEIMAAAALPKTRFLVLHQRRPSTEAVRSQLESRFKDIEVEIPFTAQQILRTRDILVLRRR